MHLVAALVGSGEACRVVEGGGRRRRRGWCCLCSRQMWPSSSPMHARFALPFLERQTTRSYRNALKEYLTHLLIFWSCEQCDDLTDVATISARELALATWL